MGACAGQPRVEDVENNDVILMNKPQYKPEHFSSSIDVLHNKEESVDSDVIDVIVKKSCPAAELQCFNSKDSEPSIPKTTQVREIDLGEEIPAQSRPSVTWNKIPLSSFQQPKKSPLYSPRTSRLFSTDSSSCPSKDGVSRMIDENTSQISTTYSLSDVFDTFDSKTNPFKRQKKCSFDGLNMRITNRYDIGLEVLKATVHHGADPKRMSTHGDRSSLMFAVLANDMKFIKDLVEMGVDVNQTSQMGETALSLACELQRDDIANYLRLNGAIDSVAKKL